jgi:hypothetical protein
MNCPECNHKLPFYSGNTVTCNHCHSELHAKNGLVVHLSLLLAFGLLFKQFISNVFDENIFFGIALLVGVGVILQVLRSLLIEYECVKNQEKNNAKE